MPLPEAACQVILIEEEETEVAFSWREEPGASIEYVFCNNSKYGGVRQIPIPLISIYIALLANYFSAQASI